MILVFLILPSYSGASTYLQINDQGTSSPLHVYAPGSVVELELSLESDQDCKVKYQWRDAFGHVLSPLQELPRNTTRKIRSVEGLRGYIGLLLSTDCEELTEADGFAGGQREVGFAFLPPKSVQNRQSDPESPFGMVHADRDDPYLGPWSKTLTWRTTPLRFWSDEISERQEKGMFELPIVAGQDWYSEDMRPITATQLGALASRIEAFFKAAPSADYWELGLEENLTRDYYKEYYWQNLEAKVKTVRETLQRVAPDTQLIYQIATVSADRVEPFAQSRAARYFDILSLHPYKWPAFPAPDSWLAELVDRSREILRANNLNMPIWFTEVGAPHHGSAPGEFFGYPAEGKEVQGLRRAEAMGYMAKVHAIALYKGVEKVFWYNYRDRDFGNDYAENFFGLRDFWGFPKPVYSAYARLVMCLNNPRPAGTLRKKGVTLGYQFKTADGEVTIAWNPEADKAVSLSLSELGIQRNEAFLVLDLLGNPIPIRNDRINLNALPIFVARGGAVAQCRGE